MASVKFEKGSHEWHMFLDYWKLCQKFWIPENNDEYWEAATGETRKFYKKYRDVDLGRQLALAFIKALDEQHKVKMG